MDHVDDGHDASKNLLWSVTMIISAHPQHHHLQTNRPNKTLITVFFFFARRGSLSLFCQLSFSDV